MARLVLLWQVGAAVASLQHQGSHHHRAAPPKDRTHAVEHLSSPPAQSTAAPAAEIYEVKSPAEEALRREREHIFESVETIASGMDNGVGLHRMLSREKLRIAKERQDIGNLRKKAANIREAHDQAARKLNDIMVPRIRSGERRLAKRHQKVIRAQQMMQRWEATRDKAKARTVEFAQEKNQAAKVLAEAREAVKEAARQAELVQHKYEMLEGKLAREAQAFEFAETKASGGETEVARALQQEEAIEKSLSDAHQQLTTEQMQFDVELEATEDKLERKLNKAEAKKEAMSRAMFATKDKFMNWQMEQKEMAREVVAMRSDYEERQKALQEMNNGRLARNMEKAINLPKIDEADWAWER